MTVKRYRDGEIWVNSVQLTKGMSWPNKAELVMIKVRERTPDEWWEHAAEVLVSSWPTTPMGPMGAGVSFYLDDEDGEGLLFPADVRQEIASDAFEAARETIMQGISTHLRHVAGVWKAL